MYKYIYITLISLDKNTLPNLDGSTIVAVTGTLDQFSSLVVEGPGSNLFFKNKRDLETKRNYTPPKFNMAPQKWWLEDYFPIGKVTFQGLC